MHPSKKIWGAGLLAIVAIVLVSYHSSLRIGFLGDDWWFLGKAASLNLLDYLAFYFDPAVQIFWYRPLYGMLLLIEYTFFHSTPEGYHLVQVLLHLVNCLLLFVVLWLLSGRWRFGWLSAAFYAALPVYGSAIFWIAVQDPLAMCFFMATILLWILYLRSKNKVYYGLAFLSFVSALLSKETSAFLLLFLFLLGRWFIKDEPNWNVLFRKYVPFGFVLLFYFIIEKQVQANAYFPNHWGYSLGGHILENALRYLALIAVPWVSDLRDSFVWLGLAIGVFLVILPVVTRSRLLVLLSILIALTIAPALPFPTLFFSSRYLYIASIGSAILLALLIESLRSRLPARLIRDLILPLLAVLLILSNGLVTSDMAEAAVEYGRQSRVPLRDIYQKHPSYPPGSFLYFIEPPYPMILRNLTGMFLLRYGSGVTVWSNDAEWGGRDENRVANLHGYPNSLVYYFDDSKQFHEVAVDRLAESRTAPQLPARLQAPLRLEGYEVTSTRLRRESEFVLLLYWRGTERIEKDYTVFVHLTNAKGEIVLGEDSQPRGGRFPTSRWQPDKLVVDAHILTIPSDVPPGEYRLEVGLYFPPTLERVPITDENNRPVDDKVVIAPFEVLE